MNERRDYISAEYYQNLHDNNQAFISNNWLVSEVDLIRELAGDANSIVELGCGNGRFLEIAAEIWSSVTGVDWARSVYLERLLSTTSNIRFIQADISTLVLADQYDLLISADFLEHLSPEVLDRVIAESLRAGRVNFHKIACYDDGHSHLSILPPEEWLARFNSQPGGEGIRIVRTEFRKGNPKNVVIVLSNKAPGQELEI